MTDIADWQGGVGRNWAAQWQRTDVTFSELTPRLLEAIAEEPGGCIIDIGCGAGEIAAAPPRDLSALARIPGVGAGKLDRYGKAVLEVLAAL